MNVFSVKLKSMANKKEIVKFISNHVNSECDFVVTTIEYDKLSFICVGDEVLENQFIFQLTTWCIVKDLVVDDCMLINNKTIDLEIKTLKMIKTMSRIYESGKMVPPSNDIINVVYKKIVDIDDEYNELFIESIDSKYILSTDKVVMFDRKKRAIA